MHLKTRLFIALSPLLPIVLLSTSAQAFNPEQLKQFLKTNQCQNCDLSGATLDRLNLSGANLQGANLSSATLAGSNLSNANLEAANLQGALLSDAYLYRANLTAANFSNAILPNANLRETTLVGTNFSRADLRSADLQGNNLGQTLFPGSNLSGANLSKTIGFTIIERKTGANKLALLDFMPNAICPLREEPFVTTLEQTRQGIEVSGLDLKTADLSGVNFTGSNLQYSVLIDANLSNVDLTGANLKSACLLNVKLTGAKLDRTDWTAARLIETEIPSGDIEGAIALTPQRTEAVRRKEFRRTETVRRKEFRPKITTESMIRSQEAYYLEHGQFTNKIENLMSDFKPDPGDNDYAYRLFIAPDLYPAAMQAAIPKTSDLLTFLGLVYGTKLGGQTATLRTLCVSEKPGTPMPLWNAIDYKNPKKGEPIACPFGFTPVK